MAPVTPSTSPAPAQVIRLARLPWRAPMFVATMAVRALPMPKAMGTRMYSRRAAMP
jgi:hypothetical protein